MRGRSPLNLKFVILNATEAKENHKPCNVAGCPDPGLHKAPKSRTCLHSYYWFCLKHIRDYNARWDYFADFTEAQIEAQKRADSIGERPTWPFGSFGQKMPEDRPINIPEALKAPLLVLELSFPFTLESLKKQYKKMVKLYHPDLPEACETFTEKIKSINNAYEILYDYITLSRKAKAA